MKKCIKHAFYILMIYLTDEEIISGIQIRDDQALEVLYKIHFGMISHFILQNNGTDQEAKDIYQEAIMAFYQNIQSGKLALHCKIKTYLYSVCRRLWLKRLAQKKRFINKIEDFEKYVTLPLASEEIENQEREFAIIEESLSHLGEPCRTIIEDFYINDFNMVEIAEKFGYTNAENAKNQKYKCLQRLKKLFFSTYTINS